MTEPTTSDPIASRSGGSDPIAPRPSSLRWMAWILVALAVGVGGVFFVRARQKKSAAAAASASASASGSARVVPVVVTTLTRKDLPIDVEGLGNVTAFYTVTIKPQVDGVVTKVLFTEGQPVKKGDVLVQIDPRPFAIQASVARAALARDGAILANARVNLQRYQELLAGGVGSQQQVADQKAEVAKDEAIVAGDQAALQNAALQVEWSRVVAPIDGVTGVRLVDPGNIVHPSDPTGLVVVTQIDPIAVFFALPEDALPRVTEAMHASPTPLKVEAFARDGETKLGEGDLAVIDNQINAATATIRLKAIMPNGDRKLWPNQFVKARLTLGVEKGVIVVPATVVQRGPQGTFAYVVNKDQTVAVRAIQVAFTQGDVAVIGKGLEQGDVVVVDGQSQLRPGAKIAAKPSAAPSSSTNANAAATGIP